MKRQFDEVADSCNICMDVEFTDYTKVESVSVDAEDVMQGKPVTTANFPTEESVWDQPEQVLVAAEEQHQPAFF